MPGAFAAAAADLARLQGLRTFSIVLPDLLSSLSLSLFLSLLAVHHCISLLLSELSRYANL